MTVKLAEIWIVLALMILPAVRSASAQAVSPAPLMLAPHHVTLAVADVDRERQWYQRVLGFQEVKRSTRGTMLVVRLVIPGYRLDLVWEKGSSRPPRQPRAFQQGWMNAVFATPSLDLAYEHLRAEGVEVKVDRDAKNALEHLTFEDPEGNEIGLAPPDSAVDGAGGADQKLTAEDYVAIQQLYATYVVALDVGDGARLANTFTADGEFTGSRGVGHGGEARVPLKGTAALREMGNARGGARHFTANLVVTPVAGGVKGSCYLLLFNVHNRPATIVETAIYEDTLVKTAEGWKFKQRIVWRDDDDNTPFKSKPVSLPDVK